MSPAHTALCYLPLGQRVFGDELTAIKLLVPGDLRNQRTCACHGELLRFRYGMAALRPTPHGLVGTFFFSFVLGALDCALGCFPLAMAPSRAMAH